jgi:hypothetical protein
MRQRRDPAGKFDRPAAGRIARCIAFQPADPVYGGKSNHRPDQHRPDREGYPARGSRMRCGSFRHIVCHPVSDTAMQSFGGAGNGTERSLRGRDHEWQVMNK